MIEIKSITKRFPDLTVFDSYSATVKKGSITAITSPSGKGKTTLLRMIAGIDKSYSGEIIGVGRVSYCPQSLALLPWYSAKKNLTVFLGDSEETIKRIDEALKAFGLFEARNKKPHELSGGMCQRIAIIRAWLADSDTILLDEPFKGLDGDTKLSVISYLKETKKEDTTIIFTTHSEEELELFSDDVLKL